MKKNKLLKPDWTSGYNHFIITFSQTDSISSWLSSLWVKSLTTFSISDAPMKPSPSKSIPEMKYST